MISDYRNNNTITRTTTLDGSDNYNNFPQTSKPAHQAQTTQVSRNDNLRCGISKPHPNNPSPSHSSIPYMFPNPITTRTRTRTTCIARISLHPQDPLLAGALLPDNGLHPLLPHRQRPPPLPAAGPRLPFQLLQV